MLVIGAGGLAKQLVSFERARDINGWFFYDDMNDGQLFLEKYKVLKSLEEIQALFLNDNKYIMAISGCENKITLRKKYDSMGGELMTFISNNARVSELDGLIGRGTIILSDAKVEASTSIGECCLINVSALVAHDCHIGNYTEIGPGATCLGRVTIGKNCLIGANATILPNISIGDNVRVGAGAVVSKNIESYRTVKGIPAV